MYRSEHLDACLHISKKPHHWPIPQMTPGAAVAPPPLCSSHPSVGHSDSQEALKIARTLVVGYIEEEDGGEQPNQTQPMDEGHRKEEGEHCRGCEDDLTEEEKFTEAQPPAPAEEKGDLALGKPGVRSWGEDNSAVSIDALVRYLRHGPYSRKLPKG